VVKADGYGLGIAEVGSTLAALGARTFFVATLEEAARLRAALDALPGAERCGDAPPGDAQRGQERHVVYVLDGLMPGTADAFRECDARPVLSSPGEVEEWDQACRRWGRPFAAALHVDTGMTRLGLAPGEVSALADRQTWISPALIMSHFACADTPDHPMNAQQRAVFQQMRALFPAVPASLANSAALLTDRESHLDIARPGIALYGGRAHEAGANPMAPVAHVYARILRIFETDGPTAVGYGATVEVGSGRRLATLALGYADGLMRRAEGATVYVDGVAAPLVGRISMDLCVADVTACAPARVHRGAWVEVLGTHTDVDSIADAAGTIGYEVLTRLGDRFARVWIGAAVGAGQAGGRFAAGAADDANDKTPYRNRS